MKPDRPLTIDDATQPATKEPPREVAEWQERLVRRRLKEADKGEFATPEEMKATIRKYVPVG